MRYAELIPRPLRFALLCVCVNMAMFTGLRLAFLAAFNTPADPLGEYIWRSLYLGFKFDMRLAALMNLPLLALGWIRQLSIFASDSGRRFWTWYLGAVNLFVLLVYIFDFGFYSYLNVRMDATALDFLKNPLISLRMIWETYHVVPIALGVLVFMAALVHGARKIVLASAKALPATGPRWGHALIVTAAAALMLGGVYGKLSRYPLRWSDAFYSQHPLASALALNPVLYFIETAPRYKQNPYDEKLAREHYPLMARYLGMYTHEPLDFRREIRPSPALTNASGAKRPPNVIIVLLESFAFYKTGIFGNPLNPTPHFDAMARQGALFTRFYTPSSGTARSVFTLVTGLPDVETDRTATRNPMIVRQHTIINDFKGHDKFYFLGGSLNWANIRGLLMSNIEGLKIHEEGSYASEVVDVWGIPDLNLFEEANTVLRINGKPFFAVIQTSGNHRPYTIPEDNRGFVMRAVTGKEVTDAGFISPEEFNSFRFMDHSIGWFIEAARKEAYFDNTIFVFFGDHGLPGHASHMIPAEDQLSLTTNHVPLVIFAPGMLAPALDGLPASEVDVLPTVAALAGIPHTNTTLGRDLFNPAHSDMRYAFTMLHNPRLPNIGLIGKDYVFTMNADGTSPLLNDYHSQQPRVDVSARHPQIAGRMAELVKGFYETARYMLYHNAPQRGQQRR